VCINVGFNVKSGISGVFIEIISPMFDTFSIDMPGVVRNYGVWKHGNTGIAVNVSFNTPREDDVVFSGTSPWSVVPTA